MMTNFLLAAAVFILFTVAIGLFRILYGPDDADRAMAAQLFGSGGIATLLLVASATHVPGVEDVAMGLALLAAFASIAFVNSITTGESEGASDK
jgi:multicomponent Na+:H+ antiporter subunit F